MTDGGLVDLRSDTVTRPTAAMREAMAAAEVGDDGYGEDPTVNRLEEAYAQRVGKPAAVFVPSGTMANQIALRLLGRPGTLVCAGRRQHVVVYEDGAAAVNSPAQLVVLDDADGTLDPEDVAAVSAGGAHHQPEVSAVFVEDTHMPSGGRPWPIGRLEAVCHLGLPVHLDGARLFNAEVASGVPAAVRASGATTVMSCLSKGLGAPVGSVLAGTADLMDEARRHRKRLGGAMRQAGVVAAAGLVALGMVERLAEDHRRARRLAEVVADRWPTAGVDPADVATNCVVFRHADPPALLEHLRASAVLAGTIGPGIVRLMTHLDVDDAGLERACAALRDAP
ncbi:MAG: DegT/DnrJ/EryC1/StrS family aminotransferase [Actinobacteria bacterium]|nr:DegT/DnrJ/EryC1/StrS family aminotransferase [Actinomycetota bacterium]